MPRKNCHAWIADSVADGLFTPPSEQGTLLYPFTGGGANWGGAAYDPMRNLLVVNMNNLAHHIQLIPGERVEHARRVFHDQEVSPQTGAPFGMKRELLLSPLGLPCTPPPWGVLAGVDLASGEIVWRTALGEVYGVTLGLPSVGGPIVTAGGLVFIGSTPMDDMLRAFDVETGALLWQGALPAGGGGGGEGDADDVRVGRAAVRGDLCGWGTRVGWGGWGMWWWRLGWSDSGRSRPATPDGAAPASFRERITTRDAGSHAEPCCEAPP